MSFPLTVFRSSAVIVSAASFLASGCGSAPPAEAPVVAPTPVETAPTVAKSQGPCASIEACSAEAKQAITAGDKEKGKALYAHGCELGDGEACVYEATMLDKDDPKKLELFQKACDLKSPDGCFNAAEKTRHADVAGAIVLYKKACSIGKGGKAMACGRGAFTAYEAHDFDSARALGSEACDGPLSNGCGLLGVMAANGEGGPRDEAKAKDLFDRGCKGGDDAACSNAKNLAALSGKGTTTSGTTGLTVDDANLSMGSMSADGFTMRDIACKTEDGGLGALMAGPAIAGAVASKKAQLRACSPKGGEARVRFTMSGGHTQKVEAKAATPAVETCVVKVMKTVPGLMPATCAITLDLDK